MKRGDAGGMLGEPTEHLLSLSDGHRWAWAVLQGDAGGEVGGEVVAVEVVAPPQVDQHRAGRLRALQKRARQLDRVSDEIQKKKLRRG